MGGVVKQVRQRAAVAMATAPYRVISRGRFASMRARAQQGDRLHRAIDEVAAAWVHFRFTDLPERAGRAELLHGLIGTEPSEAMHILGWLHEAVQATDGGDVCELGCAHGATTALIANELLEGDRDLWVYDSFEGLSTPTAEDELVDDILDRGTMSAYAGTMAYPEAEVRSRLRAVGFPERRTHVVKGYVEDTLAAEEVPARVAFAYVDMDLYAPIRTALEFLADRMAPGGIIVVDDYGWFSAGAARAVDEWLEATDRFEALRPEPWAGHFIGLRASS